MGVKDMIEHPPSDVPPDKDGATEPWDSSEAEEADMDVEEEGLIREDFEQGEHRVGSEFDGRLCGKSSSLAQVAVVVTESAEVFKNCDESSSGVSSENVLLISKDHISLLNDNRDGKSLKRARVIYEEEQASVRVSYSSLTRSSKQKLEELMQHWSEWHAQHNSSLQDSELEMLESGEQTFFPALHVGEKKQSAVSFWIDQQPGKLQTSGLVLLDSDVPLYDRDYGFGLTSADDSSNLEGGLERMGEAARCFNCGSYSHSMKDCPKPRDNVAVSNARKQHRSKRNQTAASRSSTRYYEDAPTGKFDGLKPGCLDTETRKLLGLGEFDPPPWLNRMRELGYPPGYLDEDNENQESGITIFAEEETKPDVGVREDGEILEECTESQTPSQPRKKMSVKFPGINSPIPDDADPRQWSATGSSSTDPTRHRPRHRSSSNYSTEQASGRSSYHKEFYRSSPSRYDNPREEERETRYHNEHHRAPGSGYLREDGRSEPVERPYSFHYKFYSPRDDNPPPPGTESRDRYSSPGYDGTGESNRRRGGNSRPRSPESCDRWEPT